MTPDWILNGKTSDRESVYRALLSAADPEILVRGGGFLFQAYGDDLIFRFGMLPVLNGTRRYYHHEIDLGTVVWPRIVGQFSVDGAVGLLVPPRPGQGRVISDPGSARRQIEIFCRHLTAAGYPAGRHFDWITRNWISDMRLYGHEIHTVADILGEYRPEDIRSV